MWLEIIKKYQEKNEIILDLNFELHQSIYIKELLKDIINFNLEENELIITKNDEIITNEEFFYWWQITRFNELFKEETDIYNEFSKLKNKINKAFQKINNPVIKSEDNDKIKLEKQNIISENKAKIEKLNNHIKVEADKSNEKINSLKHFRVMVNNFTLVERLLKNIKIIIMNTN